jgi:hypothetical protein
VYVFGAPVAVTLTGANFGEAPTQLGDWTAAQQVLEIDVGGSVCTDPQRGDDATYGVVLSCSLAPNTTVGARAVSLTVAGQSVVTPAVASAAFSPLLVVCGAGFFGRIGETCEACPSPGATCPGYNSSVAPSTLGGLLTNADDAPNAYPVAIPGFYSLSRTCVVTYHADGSVADACVVVNASSACPPDVAAEFPGRDTCIVACRPAAACLGANTCAPGYMSAAPYYGCGSCAPGYFAQNGACAACTGSPVGLLVGLLLLVLLLGAAGYAANRKGVTLGFVSISIDFCQVGEGARGRGQGSRRRF